MGSHSSSWGGIGRPSLLDRLPRSAFVGTDLAKLPTSGLPAYVVESPSWALLPSCPLSTTKTIATRKTSKRHQRPPINSDFRIQGTRSHSTVPGDSQTWRIPRRPFLARFLRGTAVPAGPPIFCYTLLPDRRCAEANTHPFPLSSHSPSMVSLRMADHAAIDQALKQRDVINFLCVASRHKEC